MSTITADPTLLSALSQMKDITEIRDANGRILGVYAPGASEESLLVETAKRLVDFKELDRRKREESGKGMPIDQVLKRLDAVGSAK